MKSVIVKMSEKKKCPVVSPWTLLYKLFVFNFWNFREILFRFRNVELRAAGTADPSVIPRNAANRTAVRTMNHIHHIFTYALKIA